MWYYPHKPAFHRLNFFSRFHPMQGKAFKCAALWYYEKNEKFMVFRRFSEAPKDPRKLQQAVPKLISFFLAKNSYIKSVLSNEKHVPSTSKLLYREVLNTSLQSYWIAQA